MRCPRCHSDNADTSRFCAECGTALRTSGPLEGLPTKTIATPAAPVSAGELVAGKYRVIDELGRGGMGVVVRAEDTRLKRTVALKFLSPELTGDPEARERFIQEARAASALEHPNICTIYEIDETPDGRMFMAMACYEGESLRDRLRRGKLDHTEALSLALQVARGLARAHEKGIVHRDIKPGNIFVTGDGQAKILDFGLAKLASDLRLTRTGATLGTVAYMSPEQAQGKPVDSRTDVWSLGVMLYEMLTGELPFTGDREASILYSVVHEEPRPLKEIEPGLLPEIQQVVDRALNKNPESRFSSALEMYQALLRCQERLQSEREGALSFRVLLRRLRRPRIAIPAVLIVLAMSVAVIWFINQGAKRRWARDIALPEIERLLDTSVFDNIDAFQLALQAEKFIPRDPKLNELISRCSKQITVETNPPGASIYAQEYRSPESEWRFLGLSPLEGIRVPRGYFRWKVVKEGHEQVLTVYPTYGFDWESGKEIPTKIFLSLDTKGTVPPGMVKVSGKDLPDFFIDAHEVTNRQFKEFVRSGGYREKKYWQQPFIKDGKEPTWEEALAEFVDTTGRPGPATWEAGDCPEGKEDYPVQGVSWFEAAAYAEFAGKELPTTAHWHAAADIGPMQNRFGFTNLLIPLSRFGGNGPSPAASSQSLTTFGAYDMAGNVREWCWNESPKGQIVRGGAWNDIMYMFWIPSQASPFDRSEKNGFRCVSYLGRGALPETVFQPVQHQGQRNFYEEKPISEAIFQVYKDQYFYDKSDLESRLETRDESPEDWIKEKVTFNAAYEKERVAAHLFLPKGSSPPFQAVIYFPGSEAVLQNSSEGLEDSAPFKGSVEFMIKQGRALFYPVYKGTFERRDGPPPFLHLGNGTRQYTDYLIKIVKDFRRCIDYLETRKDIDSEKLAYYGFSWGGPLGAIVPAVEDRLNVSILNMGGFFDHPVRPERARPEADEINYVTRVKIPTLMLNGKYDLHAFPYETSVKPFFDLLGTPPEHKSLVLCDTDHFIPKSILIKETLAWLDRYLGPVNR